MLHTRSNLSIVVTQPCYVRTVRVEAFGVIRASAGKVTSFLADEALGIGVLPLCHLGPALLGRVCGRPTLEADTSAGGLWHAALTEKVAGLTAVEADLWGKGVGRERWRETKRKR